jgi:ethylbenzene dehydrogenase
MRSSWRWTIPALLLAAGVLLGPLVGQPEAQQKNVLTSKKVATAPAVDGQMDDVWKEAAALTVKVVGGKNLPGGSTEVTMRSVYTADMVYFLVQYKDATESIKREPWVKQADGSWKQLKDPDDKGGDNNKYYEDKLAILWNISTPAFEQRGCLAACHTGEGKPYGNKYTSAAGERLDMWHWKGVRTGSVGQVDDQFVDNTKYDKDKAPEAGRKSDPNTGGGYKANVSDDKKGPKFALAGNKPAPPYWIVDAEKEPFDDSKYKAGDEVPGIVVAPFTGDRGDIAAKHVWKDGVMTVEMARKLVTKSEFDVQFEDPRKQYAFGVAVFDNAQVRHGYVPGVLKLLFE